MTDQQRKNLESLARAISSGSPTVSESMACGQIAIITGKSWRESLKGLEIMRKENLLPDKLIKPETVGVLDRLTSRHPMLEKFFDKFDVVPGATVITEFQGFTKPRPVDPVRLLAAFKMPEF